MILGHIWTWLARFRGQPVTPSTEIRKILAELKYNNGSFAEAAVQAAIAHRKEITPHLLAIIRETTRNAKVLAKKPDYIVHLYAMFLLAQFRETRAYPLMVEFMRLPGTLTEDLLSDTITEDADRLLVSACGGDPTLIKQLIEDSNANEWARAAGIRCINIMVFNDLLPREKAVEYFRYLFCRGLERTRSHVWNALVSCATDLHPAEVMDEIQQAYADGLVDDGFVGLDEIEDDLTRSRDSVMAKHEKENKGLIVDVADDMSWWYCFKDDNRDEFDDDEDENEDENSWLDDDKDGDLSAEDYHGKTYVRTVAKIGRNDPCSCGSGKKYKKCCGL